MSTLKQKHLAKLTPNAAWDALKTWCAWQERCHSECESKLLGHGLTPMETSQVLARLVEENYLNEERYAIQFAGGHFRMKQWGPKKIIHALRQKKVSEYCIKKAMHQLPATDQDDTLKKLAAKKYATLTQPNRLRKQQALTRFLLYKGYDADAVNRVVKQLMA